MSRMVVLALIVVSAAVASAAQPCASFSQYDGFGFVSVCIDPECPDACGIYPPLVDEGPPHECLVYVVQVYPAGIGSQFRIDDSHCALVHLSTEIHQPVVFGDPFTGIQVGYQMCVQSPILLMTLTYLCEGNSPPCSWISIAPYPDYGEASVGDCSDNILTAYTGKLWINGSDSTCPLPVEPTTWGQIKALYE